MASATSTAAGWSPRWTSPAPPWPARWRAAGSPPWPSTAWPSWCRWPWARSCPSIPIPWKSAAARSRCWSMYGATIRCPANGARSPRRGSSSSPSMAAAAPARSPPAADSSAQGLNCRGPDKPWHNPGQRASPKRCGARSVATPGAPYGAPSTTRLRRSAFRRRGILSRINKSALRRNSRCPRTQRCSSCSTAADKEWRLLMEIKPILFGLLGLLTSLVHAAQPPLAPVLLSPNEWPLPADQTLTYPLFADELVRTRTAVESALRSPIKVPYPTDPGGGPSHEQHKRNYSTLYAAGLLYRISGERAYAEHARDLLLAYTELYPALGPHPAAASSAPGRLFWQSLNDALRLGFAIQ